MSAYTTFSVTVAFPTTVGGLDIELRSKETPKAYRNLLTLAMEGYYDGVIFYRCPRLLGPNWDKTGTRNGGEMFYGELFEDEIHRRSRFVHRGLQNSNDSQFFITLGQPSHWVSHHTGSAITLGQPETNISSSSSKTKGVRLIDNPFPDIIPRTTACEGHAQQRAREQPLKEREELE
ncbi:cyclophilin-like protein [Lentinula raphanica]|nr:cyclophilin-like protein [Lentinula raphanica]